MPCGSTSRTRERQFIIDKTAPAVPTITVNGTHGPNSTDTTYVGRIIVSIKPTDKDANANKDTSGIWGIKYQVVGDNPIKETRVAGTATYNITITRVGISTVLAYTIDNATNQSEQISQEVERVAQAGDDDVGEPGITMTPTLTTEDSVVVTVKVTGETAEIEKYRFDYKLSTDTTWKTAATRVSNYRTYGYTYNELEQGKEYNLRVTATDTEGEIYSSDVQTVNTTYNGWYEPMNVEDTRYSGKTVDYIPDVATYYIRSELGGGTITTETYLGWYIWGEEKDNLYLIASSPTRDGPMGKSRDYFRYMPCISDKAVLTCYSSSYNGMSARNR